MAINAARLDPAIPVSKLGAFKTGTPTQDRARRELRRRDTAKCDGVKLVLLGGVFRLALAHLIALVQ